jgi:hypothetical protein
LGANQIAYAIQAKKAMTTTVMMTVGQSNA